MRENLAGRIAAYFLTSKLSPALVIVICVWGLLAIVLTPRQENPQITMPAATIVTRYPGASAAEVQELVTERGERVLQEVPGIEHVYSISNQNSSVMTVLFHVGDDPTKSFVDLYDQVDSHLNELPPGAGQPQITPLSVDDIPIMVLTVHGRRYDRGQLDDVAERLIAAVRSIDGVSTIETYGGLERQVNVTLDPVRLAAFGLAPETIARAIGASNVMQDVGTVRGATDELPIHAGSAYATADQVGAQIVGVSDGMPIALRQVADVALGRQAAKADERFGWGGAAGARPTPDEPAVSIAIAKKAGTNAVSVADAVLATIKGVELPPGVTVTPTRNYGEKANDAVNELIQRLVEAIVIVVVLLLTLGWREALVVATAIPLTLFVTLGVGMLTGQTVNRITLFALILALGLLVDDAIVLVENIHRHYAGALTGSKAEATIRAVREVGSPTALATLTVMLSFLPMLFVTGMMGPYMRPIPLNVPIAMLASLFIAFAITPWAMYRLLRNQPAKATHGAPRWTLPFRNALAFLLDRPRWGNVALVALLLAFLASAALPVAQLLQFRMLPDANETTFLVSIDAPPSSPLARTTAIAGAVAEELARVPEVANYEISSGANSVPDLASLLQGTVFRNAPNLADIRVNLVPKGARRIQSAALVAQLRPRLAAVAARYGATLRILQTPPGPPVRDTILAKIYGPEQEGRRAVASRIAGMLERERGVVDIDSSFKPLPASLQVEVDQREAAIAGVTSADIAQTLELALRGAAVSTLHTSTDARPVGIFLRFAPQYRADATALASIQIPTRAGGLVPLSAIAHVVAQQVDQPLYRDDFQDVSYVGADMAGRSSTYAVLDLVFALMHDPLPAGYHIVWDGEWLLTNVVFADLGRAMLIAFLLIYFVLVARFRSFAIPLVVLAAVPLAVIGVMPGFAILAPFGIYFSATAMIGLIALIGIVVRNSIILIEFIEDRRRDGAPLRDALVDAATARTRPIFLTAAAGVLSSMVIAADPVWSGLAWALVFGMTASAMLSVIAIPLLYARIARTSDAPTHGGSEARRLAPALTVLAAVLLLSHAPASAAETVAAAPLSLDAAVSSALARNPGYRIAHTAVAAAAGRLRQSSAPRLPNVALRDGLAYADPVAQLSTPIGALPFSSTTLTNVPMVTVQYQLFDGGRSAARVSQAAAALAGAQADERSARMALIDETTKAYFDLVAAIQYAAVADGSLAVAQTQAADAQRFLTAGQVPRADVLRAQTGVADQRVAALAAHDAVALAQLALDDAIGAPLGELHLPTDPLDTGAPDIALDTLLRSASANRGDLVASRAALDAAVQALKEARATRSPRIDLAVGDGNVQPAVAPGYRNQVSFGLNAVWTLFDGGASAGEIDAAQAGIDRAKLALDELSTGVERSVRQRVLELTDAKARVAAAQTYVALADENLRLAQVRYRGGVGTVLEVQDAEQRAGGARQMLIAAQVAVREGIVHVRFAAGLL